MIAKPVVIDPVQRVLEAFRVKTIVCVDDIFVDATELGIEQVLAALAIGLATESTREGIIALFPSITFGDESDLFWREQVQEQWESLGSSERNRLLTQVGEISGSITANDRNGVTQLRAIVEDLVDVQLLELAPDTWRSTGNELIDRATADSRLLCLFDQDLSAAGYGKNAGLELVESAVRTQTEAGVPDVICALLTHTITKENEERKWREMARSGSIDIAKVLPMSKQRLGSPKEFAEGLCWAMINLGQERMKGSVDRISKAVQADAINELRDVSVWDFDRIVLKSSAREGVWEAHTLFRLYKLLTRRPLQNRLFKGQERLVLDTSIQMIQDSQTALGEGPEMPEGSKVWELRHLELYADEEINEVLAPLELGDLFESIAGQRFILLAQPCDLMLRGNDGGRRASVATLVPIESRDKPSKAGRHPHREDGPIFYPKCPYFPAIDDGRYWLFNFRNAAEVSLDVLDSAAFRTDGNCQFDTSLESVEGLFAPSRLRYQTLRRLFLERDEVVRLGLQMGHEAGMSDDDRTRLLQQLLSGFSIQKGILFPTYQDGMFMFGLRRVGRYLGKPSEDLHAWFESFRARPADEHDFASLDK